MMNGSARILVVEDDDVERESMAQLLRLWGYEARVASDGLEALREISSSAFDLIVSDLHMPCMSGLQLLKELQGRFPSLSCIIVSGAEDPFEELEALRLGAWGFFKKPIPFDQLRAAVRSRLNALRSKQPTRPLFSLPLFHSKKPKGLAALKP
jgi:DNA-binding NtrC family response regulator